MTHTTLDDGTVEVTVQRHFPVLAERVFDAWLTPRLLGQWMFGPGVRDEKVLRLDVDPRIGGRFSLLVERGGARIDHVGEYLAIDRPHRLSFTWGIAGEPDQDGSRVGIVITSTPAGCDLRLTHVLPQAWAGYADRTRHGWATMLDALHALFRSAAATPVSRQEHTMDDLNTRFGTLVAPGTLRLQRSLPGPIERVWHCLTDSEARGRWLARGPMDLRIGGEVRLEFRHDDLSDERAPTPARYRTDDGCHRQSGRVTACEPPRLLAHTWGEADGSESEVRFDLEPQGDRVLLTITHSRLGDRDALLSVAAGWHAHAGILVEHLEGRAPGNFWTAHEALEAAYAQRLPRDAA